MRLILFVVLLGLITGVLWASGLLLEPEGVKPPEAQNDSQQATGKTRRGPPGKQPF